MTNEQKRLGRRADELSPTELAEHKKLDAVRTHTCTQCGTIFAVEILKCPACSTIVAGGESNAWSNFSYRHQQDFPREDASDNRTEKVLVEKSSATNDRILATRTLAVSNRSKFPSTERHRAEEARLLKYVFVPCMLMLLTQTGLLVFIIWLFLRAIFASHPH